MPLLHWENRFYVNDARLDSDHRQMFDALNDLWQIVDQDSDPSTIQPALAHVSTLMKAHFEKEEAILDEWNYPRLQDHRQEHRQFTGRLDLLTKRLMHDERSIGTAETLDLIGDWLCNHILKNDRDYALFRAGQLGDSDGAAAYRMARRSGFRRLNKTGTSLVLAVVAVNLFVAGLLGYGLQAAKEQKVNEIRVRVENTALRLDHNISELTGNIDLEIREISDRLDESLRTDGRLDGRKVNAFLERRQAWAPDLSDLLVTDGNGVARYGRSVEQNPDTSSADRDQIIARLSTPDDKLLVSDPFFGRVAKQWLIPFSRSYRKPDGSFAGIVVATVPVSDFTHRLSVGLGPDSVALLWDADLHLITRFPPGPTEGIGQKTFSGELAAFIESGQKTGTRLAEWTGDGIDRINAYRRLDGGPFHLVVGMATEESLAPWRAEVFKAVVLFVSFLLFSSAAGWLFWRSFGSFGKADHSAQLLREMARMRQRLSEAQRIARFGFIEVATDKDLWLLGEGTQEMLGLAPTQISGSPGEVLVKAVPEDRARLVERLCSSDAPAFDLELRVESRTLHVLAGTIRDGENAPRIIMTFKDITQLRTAEEERARMLERMSEASRLESLGTLAGGIAHEINTPAQFIGDNLSFIRDWLPRLLAVIEEARRSVEKGSLTELAERLQSFRYDFAARELPAAAEHGLLGIGRISGIVQAIKEFSYPSGKTPELFDLNHAIERAATITHNEWKYVAELNLDLTPGVLLLNAIEGEISQVLVNLIVNAAQAIEEKGAREKGRIDIHSHQIDGAIEFSVSDSGVGIPKENLERLYELFFTTKPPGKGTGQGLALSKIIVSRHGGTITARSTLGAGTSFHVRLPVSGPPLP